MAGIHFDITGENRNFLQSLRGAENGVRQTANAMEQYGQQIEGMFNKIKTAAELSLAGFTVKGFAEKVALVRGEFQQLEVAFETMLGSADKARAMMDDMTRLAATTPFDLQGVANGAKQLLAYGMEADKITDTLRRLGDVAAGLGIQLGDLTYLYGTTMAQGRLYTQDLNQFTGRGIPMIRELAKQFGVAESEVKDLVTAGKVGFPEVEKVIQSLTDKGGQFGGLMEAQSHTIVGQISNIEDSIDMMFNEMGKSSEGAINTVLDCVGFAIDHYKEFGSVILGVVASYGEWKAAAMIVNSWHNMVLNQAKEIEETRQSELSALADKFKDTDDTAQTQANTVAKEQNTIARNANKSAIDAEIAALEEALKVKLAEAEANYNSATSKAAEAALAVDDANDKVSALKEEYEAILKTGNAEKIEAAEMELNTAVAEANGAQKNLLAAREEVATASTAKNTAATKLNTLQTQVDTIQKKANTTATGIWAAVTKTATTAVRGLTAAIAANPIGALLVGITTALSLIPMFSSETEEASAEVTRFGEAAVKQTNNVETLLSVIESTSDTSKVHKDSVDELIKIYDEYGVSIDKEQDQLQQLIDKHDELIKKIREEGEERQKANLIQSYEEGMTKALEEMQQAWSKAYQNAEYDGSGLFDDWDANDFQDKADQISLVANAIAQGEFEKLQQIVEDGGTVTQEQINETIQRVKERVEQESQKLSGSSLYTSSYDEVGNEIRHYIDIDYEGIMENYADKVLNLASARRELVEEIKNTKKATDDEAESVDYSSMSFSDLIDKAYGAKDAVESVGNTDGTPTIDTKPADDATSAIEVTQGALNTLNSMTATPFVNTQYINNALMQTGNLINSLNTLGQSPLFSGTGVQMPKFNLNTSGFGLNVGGPKLGFNTNFNFGSSMYGYNPIATDPAAQARAELMNRVNNARSDSKVDALLKEVNDALKDATYGSNERAELAKLQKTLQDRKKTNITSSSSNSGKKGSSGKTTAEKVADEQERLEDMTDDIALQRIRKEQDLANRLIDVRLEAEGNSALILAKKRQQENKEEILQIERERDEAIKAYVDAERKIFEQKEKIKKTQNSKYKEQKFDESIVDVSAIREQYEELKRLTQERQETEQRRENLQSMRKYLKEYGDELQQEAAITEDYQERIAEARANGNEGEALLLEKNMQEELSAMRLTNLRNSAEYIRAFEDLGNTSNDTLKALIKRFEDAKESAAKSLDPYQLREYTETLQQMYDELDNRNPFEALTNALKELADAQKDVKSAQNIYKKVKAGEVVINHTTGNAYTEADASERLSNAKDREAKVYNKLTKASMACADKLNQFAATLNNLGDMVGGTLGDSLGALGGVLVSVGSAFENIKNINVNATGIEKALGQFSAVTGTVSAMVEMNRQLDKLLPDTESLYEHYAAKQRELNEKHMRMIELEIEQLEQRLNAESWFYENGLTQLKKNAELNAQYAKAYGEVAAMPQEVYKNASSGFSKWAPAIIGAIVGIVAGVLTFGAGAGPGAALGTAIGSAVGGTAIGAALGSTVISMIGTAIFSGVGAALGNAVRAGIDGITYDEGQTAAINNMRVQTRHKTFFRSEKTQDLQSWVKENFGQDLFEDVKGVQLIDPEVAKKLLEDGPTLVGETRETLEKLLEYSEKIREFIDQIHEYVSEAFGPLVDNLSDALWDWLTDGKDVLDSFREYAADTFKNIAQDALKAMITKNIFEPFQEQLEDLTIAYSTGQIDETAYMAAVAAFAQKAQDSIQTQLPVLQNAAEVINMAMQNAGIDMTGQTKYDQQASKGVWGAMGEDTGQELNGRFTAVQMNTADMADRMLTTLTLLTGITDTQASNALILGEIRNMMVYTNSYLEDVVKYAKMTYNQFGTKLDDIVKNTKNM